MGREPCQISKHLGPLATIGLITSKKVKKTSIYSLTKNVEVRGKVFDITLKSAEGFQSHVTYPLNGQVPWNKMQAPQRIHGRIRRIEG
jgi:hypothetical protein